MTPVQWFAEKIKNYQIPSNLIGLKTELIEKEVLKQYDKFLKEALQMEQKQFEKIRNESNKNFK
jgi:hypothetical protein